MRSFSELSASGFRLTQISLATLNVGEPCLEPGLLLPEMFVASRQRKLVIKARMGGHEGCGQT